MSTLIRISEETKKLLDGIKAGSYDETIRKLLNPNPAVPYVISLTRTVPASTWITRNENYKEMPFTGRVLSCSIFTPIGCEDLVFIKIGIGDKEMSDWIQSGDNKTISVPINQAFAKGTKVWAEIMNKDETYPHTPTIEFIVSPLALGAL